MTTPTPHLFLAALTGWLAFSPGTSAQTTGARPPDASVSGKAGELVVLAPFQVQAEDNSGWTPAETLAGTRMRTKLADVASQMDVFTLDFMQEFGFNSVEEASIYSLNIENGSEYVANVESKEGGQGNLRVRGIGQVRRSREFFATGTRADNYNLERVTLASGPNPMMFGIGAPTGAIDATLARPMMDRNTAKTRMQVDSFGGLRGEFHLNRTLLPGKLAFRGALLAENKKADIKPSIERDRRM
jgi:outer membrane receptor protein involved in Fe transport